MIDEYWSFFLCVFSRMHLALKAYQELLLTINEMDQSKDESIRQSSVVIKSRMQFWCLTNFHLFSFSCRFHSFSFFSFATLTVLSCVYYDSLGNIFYLMEYREIFLTLLRKFDETQQPRSYLKDLVESTHLFLRMLERFSKGRKNLMVQVKFFSSQLWGSHVQVPQYVVLLTRF